MHVQVLRVNNTSLSLDYQIINLHLLVNLPYTTLQFSVDKHRMGEWWFHNTSINKCSKFHKIMI